METEDRAPVAIVGGGPTGIAAAIELGERGIDAVVYERGCLADAIFHFPEDMTFFSTPERLEIAGVPFVVSGPKPSRRDALAYYRKVAERFGVRFSFGTEVVSVRSAPTGSFELTVRDLAGERVVRAEEVILAVGFFHQPRRLDIPGSDQSHVFSRYVSGHPYFGRDVVVVGGRNSAAEASLDLFRHGARVTLVHRGEGLHPRVKPWVLSDLSNRIAAQEIQALFRSAVREIGPDHVVVETSGVLQRRAAEAVFPMIGYTPDFDFLQRCGILLETADRIPRHDSETFESNVPGLFIVGSPVAGIHTGRIFIENSRFHAVRVAEAIAGRRRSVISSDV
jgi:bacillithiol disulfide reductase